MTPPTAEELGLTRALVEVWEERFRREEDGLEFCYEEDRAAFRARATAAMRGMKTHAARQLAWFWGQGANGPAGNSTHERAVRCCADNWMRMRLRAAIEVRVTAQGV